MKCITDKFTLGKFLSERNMFNIDPTYQRESEAWSLDKKQLFIDSLLNGFDVPKFYFHNLEKNARYDWAVVDGKQRLTCIWNFLDSNFPLPSTFKFLSHNKKSKKNWKIAGLTFSNMPHEIQESLKSKSVDAVIISDANENDIEELFSRLNNGVPLNSAEARNAFGGQMNDVFRQVSKHVFFDKYASFKKDRYAVREVAAKIILIEKNVIDGGDHFVDAKKANLDRLAQENKVIPASSRQRLLKKTRKGLSTLARVFIKRDPHLKKITFIPMYYIFINVVARDYAHSELFSRLKRFLNRFAQLRKENSDKAEEKKDPTLIEFDRLIQQGANDPGGLKKRVGILKRFFLYENPEVEHKDPRRKFNEEERMVVWLRADKKCYKCSSLIENIEDMDCDHVDQHAHGGKTVLENARCACKSCNNESAKKVK